MPESLTAPYGSWKSSITSDLIVAETIGLSEPSFNDDIYWLELRPKEHGRIVLVKHTSDGKTIDITPEPFNVRTRVHEYGGGAYTISKDTVFFSNFVNQRLYRQDQDGLPQPISPETALRYADYVVDEGRGLLYCVREDHSKSGEPVNALVKMNWLGDDSGGEVVVSGNDFYSSPRLSPDGSRLAWLTWNHPNMPWDGTELLFGDLGPDGSVASVVRVAGGDEESIFQPEWSPDGTLYFISDRTGWWNLYRWRDGHIDSLIPMDAEFGQPQWVFGMSTYAFESVERLICTYSKQGTSQLVSIDTKNLQIEKIETPYTDIRYLCASSGQVLFNGASPKESTSLVLLDLATMEHKVLRRSGTFDVNPGHISQPQAIEYSTEKGLTAHAFFYPPCNCDYQAPSNHKPPLLVLSHGGPTSATSDTFNPKIQYFTSRGIAVIDVNYGGSTGYGRAFRQRLNGQWGIVDVDDCVNAARYLVERGDVDGSRLAISGGSAGGYTTLSALTFRDVFHVGASYYGVADLETLARDTHKFESRYLDNLIGPYPERRDLYMERSPIHHVDRLSCPLILLQGMEDRIVPPEQAETMYASVNKKGLPVAYLPFDGEQHGFRKAENIKRTLDAELYFYSEIFDFELADNIEPIPIDNLNFNNEGTMRYNRPTVAEIDLNNFEFNITKIREKIGEGKKILIAVKANAYGHGLVEISRFAQDNLHIDVLGVALVSEGIQLRQAGIDIPILVLGGLLEEDIPFLFKHKLTPTIIDVAMAEKISDYGQQIRQSINAQINIDTGMGRIGIYHENAIQDVMTIQKLPKVDIEGIYTHFPSSDEMDKEFTYQQIKLFEDIIHKLRSKGMDIPITHCFNSGAVIDLDRTDFNMIRPGVMIYGLYPSNEVNQEFPLKQVMTLKSKIVFLKSVQPGRTISYGRTYSPDKPTIIATVPIGYGDGYNRLLSNRGEVLVRGMRVPVVGRVTMDQIMIDLGDHPEKDDIVLGETVVLFGGQKDGFISITDIAELLNTITYEVTCWINRRVPRRYVYKGGTLFE